MIPLRSLQHLGGRTAPSLLSVVKPLRFRPWWLLGVAVEETERGGAIVPSPLISGVVPWFSGVSRVGLAPATRGLRVLWGDISHGSVASGNQTQDRPDCFVGNSEVPTDTPQRLVLCSLDEFGPAFLRDKANLVPHGVPAGPATAARPQHPLGVEERDEGRGDDVYLA